MLCSHAVKKVSIKNKPERQEIDATTFLVGRELSKCTRVVGLTAVYPTWQKLCPSFCTCPRPRHGHRAPGTLASVPVSYLALKPAKSSSKCIFLWLLWGFVFAKPRCCSPPPAPLTSPPAPLPPEVSSPSDGRRSTLMANNGMSDNT